MITKTGMHAIKALAALAELPAGTYAGAGAIAGAIGARGNYLGKLLQALAHEGLVSSQKGQGGGFRLARDPRTIRLLDVIEPIEHVTRKGGCMLGRPGCTDAAPCTLHGRWRAVHEAYMGLLTEVTIADLGSAENGARGAEDGMGERRNPESKESEEAGFQIEDTKIQGALT